ncbi:MAG: SpoIIE family protein phosphatase [Clostridiales bacterium]|nr:SpoIIE family protein phosphatase [Eubacteriales bacterium]MDH7567555.1 SpoIIE family protein phosphatase [Clostridiales bacterium]
MIYTAHFDIIKVFKLLHHKKGINSMLIENNPDIPLNTISGQRFIEEVIDGMYDWVRVLDRNDNVIYLNKAMREGLGNNPIGEKCYKMLGKDAPCENCISRKAVFEGQPHEKEETVGDRIFSVMSSPIKNSRGEIIAVVEVLRDITQVKKLRDAILKQNKKLQDDLDLARKLQCSLLPKDFPEDRIKFAFVYEPCEALGGDFLDIFKIDGDHVGMYIADVSGHGVPASMLTVFLRSSINKKMHSPSKALSDLYRQFNENNFDQGLYITVFYVVIDLKNRSMTYSNAGHNVCPIIFGKNRFQILRMPGIPISDWLEAPIFQDETVSLESGDRIFFYTDGIVELKGENDNQFGEERLLSILLNDTSEPSGTLNRIIENACIFAGVQRFSEIRDDVTLALIEIK